MSNPLLQNVEVWSLVERILIRPEMARLEMAWNRLIFHDFGRNELHLLYGDEFEGTFDDPLFAARYRNMLAPFFPGFSAVLIHAAGAVRSGRTALFLAHDGGGKTTVVRTAPSGSILSDDQLVLRRENGSIRAHGTPFGRISSGPVSEQLGACFLLEKGEGFQLTPLSASAAIEFIWNEHHLVWAVLPAALRPVAFNLICDACQGLPVYRMRFGKGDVDWDAIDAVVSAT